MSVSFIRLPIFPVAAKPAEGLTLAVRRCQLVGELVSEGRDGRELTRYHGRSSRQQKMTNILREKNGREVDKEKGFESFSDIRGRCVFAFRAHSPLRMTR